MNPEIVSIRSKKRLRHSVVDPNQLDEPKEEISPKNKIEDGYQVKRGYTISIVVAGTIIDNAVTPQLRSYLCAQVARSVGIFNIDEIIVWNDKSPAPSPGSELLIKILGYLECPQYLRRYLFPLQDDLAHVGLLPPTSLPHHYGRNDTVTYRDGIVVQQNGKCDWVDVGLNKKVHVNMRLEQGLRVTVKIENPHEVINEKVVLSGEIVSPNEPKEVLDKYWGYTVRKAQTLEEIMNESSYEEGYDMIIGTSDKGQSINELHVLGKTDFKHLLILFGGVDGLESASSIDYDTEEEYLKLFNHYINVRPTQGTRTIRAEEAIPITLTALNPVIMNTVNRKN